MKTIVRNRKVLDPKFLRRFDHPVELAVLVDVIVERITQGGLLYGTLRTQELEDDWSRQLLTVYRHDSEKGFALVGFASRRVVVDLPSHTNDRSQRDAKVTHR